MKNTQQVVKTDTTSRFVRILVLSVMGFAMIIMSGFAITADAAMLTRQLQFGMYGADVSELQMFLAKDPTVYPRGLVTGYFGPLTRSAVSRFQIKNGIPSVGRVGPRTLAVINAQMNTDTSAPVISSLSISTSNTSANFNWNTNENASGIVYYSTSPLTMVEANTTTGVVIGGSSRLAHSDFRASHSATISSLNPNTTYYYVVYSKDNFGNETITWPATFTTSN